MNIINILKEVERTDPEVFDRLSGRRDMLKGFGTKVAAAALPLAFGSLMQKAYAKTNALGTVLDVLNFALEQEYIAYNFYHSAMSTGSNSTVFLIPEADRPGFQAIEDQEKSHVNFLRQAIDAMGKVPFTPKYYTVDPVTGNPYTPASYDFTAGNKYPVYTDYTMFLKLASAFEDSGVRAYLGQMALPELLADNATLSQVMQITTVEARHAAYVRLLRRSIGAIDYPKPWITNNIPPDIFLQPFYLREENAMQQDVDITSIEGVNGSLANDAASEAFDEPLEKPEVIALMMPFLRR
jgi:hypothetical protein